MTLNSQYCGLENLANHPNQGRVKCNMRKKQSNNLRIDKYEKKQKLKRHTMVLRAFNCFSFSLKFPIVSGVVDTVFLKFGENLGNPVFEKFS